MRIRDLQENARSLSRKHGWRGDVEERFSHLTDELDELRRELAKNPLDKQKVAFEIYDVVWNACDIGNKLGIELEPFFADKEKLNSSRTW